MMSKRLCVWMTGLFRKWSSGLCDRVVWYVYTVISEEHTASIFKVEGSSETLVALYQISWCHNPDQHIFHAVKISYKCLPFSSQIHAFCYVLPFSSYWLHLSHCFLCFILSLYLSHFTSPSLLLLLLSLFQRLILPLLFTFLSQFIAPSLFSFLCLVTHPCTSLPTVSSAPLALLAETSLAHCPPHTQALGMPLSAASLCSSPRPPLPANINPFISVFITNPHLAGNTTRYFTDSVDGPGIMNCTDSCCRPGGEHRSFGNRLKIWRLKCTNSKIWRTISYAAESDLLPWETTQILLFWTVTPRSIEDCCRVSQERYRRRPTKPHSTTPTTAKRIQATWVAWRQIRSVRTNVLNNQSRPANKGRSSCEVLPAPRRKKIFYEMLNTALVKKILSSHFLSQNIIIIIIIIISCHQLGLDRPVSNSSNSLFKRFPNRSRPFSL